MIDIPMDYLGFGKVIRAARAEAEAALKDIRSDNPTPIDPVAPEVNELFLKAMNQGIYKGWMQTPLKVRLEVESGE